MGVDLDGEVPIVGTELYDTDFDAFVEVRRRVPRYPTRASRASPVIWALESCTGHLTHLMGLKIMLQ